ncbi:bifunctional 23S rRNA (guanine(2069)-N(7))-methyltransferase RlmK/23S rRNA (guanine(2445)-N(2))-methyltransferase RlmL [Motiliproteus sp.]|uniref:bifunctional 23S rRNA (guanine(2069)-N(7))-methyltransferase RlmK/23S rRNA (guanine(2445)-N(2))-methyltransferase RlmL n=1 Tax=Motiliproteus sp. TaxID=1898955 RepID=UPI003BAAEC4D
MSELTSTFRFFATCPKGLETLLAEELAELGGLEIKTTVAGVFFQGELAVGYRVCLWSRLANRILLPLAEFAVESAEQLYDGVQQIDWLEHLRSEGTLLVNFSGTSRAIKNTHFGSLKVKDAIVDQFRSRTGQRPAISKERPDLRINVHLSKGHAHLSLDLSGDSLHRRGYRSRGGAAPLKENLACALLIRSGWPQCSADQQPLVDPMCGSGTLLIEAALMAANIAPGLMRQHFGFEGWLKHDAAAWMSLLREARKIRLAAAERADMPEIHGYDANPKAVSIAKQNAERAGVDRWVRISQRELSELKALTHKKFETGLLLTNPPYGERLSEVPVIGYLYRHLGEALKQHFQGWRAAVFTGNPELGKSIAIHSHKQYKLFNGAIPSQLLLFDIVADNFVAERDRPPRVPVQSADSKGDDMFANRLRKNLKQLEKWARKQQLQCYRIYDADMPEYAVAIDRYGDWLHVQEYAPPSKVDPEKAERRLAHVMAALPGVTGVSAEQIVLKQRKRQSGKEQYQRLEQQGQFLEVTEGPAKVLVNLRDYLDTGLFLDHRPIRQWIRQNSRDKRFLNLFSYTAVASLQAALGGAASTASVDMSNTYLEWARKNYALNGLSEKLNETIQADCLQWLREAGQRGEKYDLIFMDPPSFSNSKRMREVLDVQRDHVMLIEQAMALLDEGGALIFSNNLRKFKMDREALATFAVTDITAQTIDQDFKRNQRIHNCWRITRP